MIFTRCTQRSLFGHVRNVVCGADDQASCCDRGFQQHLAHSDALQLRRVALLLHMCLLACRASFRLFLSLASGSVSHRAYCSKRFFEFMNCQRLSVRLVRLVNSLSQNFALRLIFLRLCFRFSHNVNSHRRYSSINGTRIRPCSKSCETTTIWCTFTTMSPIRRHDSAGTSLPVLL